MPEAYAFFDFDDTLYEGDSLLLWFRYYYRHRPWRRIFQIGNFLGFLLYSLRLIKAADLKRLFFLPMAYENSQTLHRLAKDFAEKELPKRFYPELMARLAKHTQNGDQIVIISASVELYLLYLQIHFPGAKLLGSKMIFPKGLWRLPYYEQGNLKGQNKITRLQSMADMPRKGNNCYAYSDSISDEPLLRFAEHAIVVEPDTSLRLLAEKKGWEKITIQCLRPRWRRRLEKLRLLLFFA